MYQIFWLQMLCAGWKIYTISFVVIPGNLCNKYLQPRQQILKCDPNTDQLEEIWIKKCYLTLIGGGGKIKQTYPNGPILRTATQLDLRVLTLMQPSLFLSCDILLHCMQLHYYAELIKPNVWASKYILELNISNFLSSVLTQSLLCYSRLCAGLRRKNY